jgi:hypothetical protein
MPEGVNALTPNHGCGANEWYGIWHSDTKMWYQKRRYYNVGCQESVFAADIISRNTDVDVVAERSCTYLPSVYGMFWRLTKFGQLILHASDANCTLAMVGDICCLRTKKTIHIGDELNIDYNHSSTISTHLYPAAS